MITKNDIINRIAELFPEEGIEIISKFDFDKIIWFYNFLLEFNEAGGFFSKKDSELVLDRHLIESIYHVFFISKILPVSRETKIIDIGTGPGLPGFLFFCLLDTPIVFLLDSQKRKLELLDRAAKSFFANKCPRFLYTRVEDAKGKYDIAVIRASVPYPWNLEMCNHILRLNGRFIPFLARDFEDAAMENTFMSEFCFQKEGDYLMKSLAFLGTRHIKVLKKVQEAKYGKVRSWAAISKEIKEYNGKSSIDQ